MGKLKKTILLFIISMFVFPLQTHAQKSSVKDYPPPIWYFQVIQKFYKTKEIEIMKGFGPGDEIIVLDISQWDEHVKIKLKGPGVWKGWSIMANTQSAVKIYPKQIRKMMVTRPATAGC